MTTTRDPMRKIKCYCEQQRVCLCRLVCRMSLCNYFYLADAAHVGSGPHHDSAELVQVKRNDLCGVHWGEADGLLRKKKKGGRWWWCGARRMK